MLLVPIAGTPYNILMQVFDKRILLKYCRKYSDVREQLLAWYADAKSSIWTKPNDIKDIYGQKVDFPGDKRVVFDIKGNSYRLVVRIDYKFQKVFVRWFGTHAEYDKIDVTKV